MCDNFKPLINIDTAPLWIVILLFVFFEVLYQEEREKEQRRAARQLRKVHG